MPQHGVQPDGDAAVIFIDQLVIITGHKAFTLVILNVFTGQLMRAEIGPDAMRLAAIVAAAQADPGGAHAAPGGAGVRIFGAAKCQQ
ncbi:hypothetical protein D3C75_995020 [compost metagenome]